MKSTAVNRLTQFLKIIIQLRSQEIIFHNFKIQLNYENYETLITYKVDLTFFLLINYSIHNNKKMQNRQIGLKPTALQIDSRKTRQIGLKPTVKYTAQKQTNWSKSYTLRKTEVQLVGFVIAGYTVAATRSCKRRCFIIC